MFEGEDFYQLTEQNFKNRRFNGEITQYNLKLLLWSYQLFHQSD